MSISLVEKEIARFLRSSDPEVICIHGKWGVGKTYSWNAFLQTAKDNKAIGLESYAYVSLFGIDSLERLKYAIFENKIAVDAIGIEPTIETFKTNTTAITTQLGRKSLKFFASLWPAKNHGFDFQTLSFLSVRKMIVCIDDLERKSDQLPMKDVMGLISYLREQKKCKVSLILNDDALALEENNKNDFEKYNEKVIDASLLFEPDPSDCVHIAVTGSGQALVWLRSAVIALKISNIRIIKKIERLVLRATPLLKDFDIKVFQQAVQSLTLFGWSVYSKDAAPPIEFLTHKRGTYYYGLQDNEEIPEDEKTWNSLLDEFGGFARADEFDLELLKGIKRGFFNEAALTDRAAEIQRIVVANEAEGSIKAAWNLYHDSFDNNGAEVVKAICDAYRKNVQFVSPMDLNVVVSLFKDLGHPKEANEILHFFMERRDEDRVFFDLSKYAFAYNITDEDVSAAFDKKYQSFKEDRSPPEVLDHIARDESWSRDDMTLLSSWSTDDFFTIFKTPNGKNISQFIRVCFRSGRDVNADEDMKEILRKVEEALVRIGKESPVNRSRVQNKFSVKVDD